MTRMIFFACAYFLTCSACNISVHSNPLALSYYKGGIINYDKQDYRGAILDFNKAVDLDPNYEEAFAFRGIVKRALNNDSGALADFTLSINISANAFAYFNRGLTRASLRDYQGSKRDFTEVVFLEPNNSSAYYNRGTVYKMLGLNDSACLDFSKANKLGYKDAMLAIQNNCK